MNTKTLLSATILALMGCDLPSGNLTSPYTWGDYFLDKYEDDLVLDVLEPGPTPLESPRVVLLITGVTIPAVWFDPIKARLERDGFIPVVYEPPALLSGDLFDNSQWLADVVAQVKADTGAEKIDILAECTGGLIARHYIQSLGGEAHVSRLVTFISPQHGVPKAAMAANIAGWPALDDLTPGSDFLAAVNNAPLPETVPITSIYTCTDEYIQPFTTSIIPGAKNIKICDGFVGHFEFFFDSDLYLVMHDALTEPLPGEVVDEEDGELKADSIPGAEEDSGDAEGSAGCSVNGSSRPTAPYLLLLGGFGLLARRRRHVAVWG